MVRSGKALHLGISSYSAAKTQEAAAILASERVPLLVHQPAYNLFNRWIEPELLGALKKAGAGAVVFNALAQGLLTDKYLNGIPVDARINRPGGGSFLPSFLCEENLGAGACTQRVRRSTRAITGANGPCLGRARLQGNDHLDGRLDTGTDQGKCGCLANLSFSAEELAEIDRYAVDAGINLWEKSSTDQRI